MKEDETAAGVDAGDDAVTEAGLDAAAESAPESPQGDAAVIEQALAAERDKYLRLAAEFDNFRKRNIRERQEAGWRAQADLVMGLIEVLDDIMRFAHLDPETVDSATVVQGVALVEKKVFKALGGHGLEVIDPTGTMFDPALHEAVTTEQTGSEEEDHLVARTFQPGYVFRGQLLRPARVVVKQFLG